MALKGKAWHAARAKAARSRAAVKAAVTRKANAAREASRREARNARRRARYAEKRTQALQQATVRWGRALDRARDLNSHKAWEAFRRAKREKDRVREKLASKRWRNIVSQIADAAEDMFDADFEES